MTGSPPAGPRAPARRLKHRIPVRVRHYWKLLVVCTLGTLALVVLAGNVQIRPIVTSGGNNTSDDVTENIAGTVDLFDATVAHSVSLRYDEAEYQRMMDEYISTGEKEYVRADLTVDGTLIEDVGIRLKGNSTLSSLTHNGKTRSRSGGGNGDRAGGGQRQMPGGGPAQGGGNGQQQGGGQMPGGGQQQGGGQMPGGGQQQGGGQMPGGMGLSSLDSAEPENLPWLISFDEFVDGRRYQGHRQIAARISGMGGGSTVLNEAVSLAAISQTAEPAQRYAYVGFQVNDRPITARLLVETPDTGFADRLGNGVLYKALSTSQFSYQGEDQTEYTDDYKQINNKGEHDLQPVIDLLKWVEQSSDEEFAAHLGEHVDVESFARYLALQNLLLNFDDMAGPGRNYYLWYDLDTKKFRVVGWDYNLTFSGNASQGPHDSTSMGGGMFGGGAPGGGGNAQSAPDGDAQPSASASTQPSASASAQPSASGGAQPPAGMQPPDGMQLPDGFTPPQGDDADRGGGFGGMRMGNKLKERFLATDAFTQVYEDAYRELYQTIYGDGGALAALNATAETLTKIEGYDATAVTSDADRLRSTIEQRTSALAEDAVISG